MKFRNTHYTHTLSTLLTALVVGGLVGARQATATALDDYVATPDASYTWSHVGTINDSSYTAYVLDMTSQTWRSPAEVDRTQWQHWLTVIKPNTVTSNNAMLWIGGGSNGGLPPTSADSMLTAIAAATNTVVAELRMVPNQRLKFADETDPRYIDIGRTEDELIAYTWDKFLRTGDENWPARLPMTKAAVRAMDTVTAFCASPAGGSVTVDQFVVCGASKRGWTTWTTAAVDPRVVAIIPIVIDVLNVEVSMKHHHAAYGFWAPSVHDYEDMGIMNWFDTPENAALMELVDPYSYRARYTMPKLLLNSTGDQFFLPDSAQFYFDDLPGEKYLRYVPNTDHGLDNSDAMDTLLAYYEAILTGTPRPQFSWTLEGDDTIRVQTVTTPTDVKLWQATNPTARDFRLETLGPAYTSSVLTDQGGGVYVAQVPEPPIGWTAFFVELAYNSGGPTPYKFTTQVRVIPDTLPFEENPPTPDPMTWATLPTATGSTSISMTATTASDPSGVEYYFACVSGPGHDSGWQDSPTYEDTGLVPDTEYTYQVKARDKSSNRNDTGWSSQESATTEPGSGAVDDPASGETPVAGTVTGSYVDTHSTDNIYEAITERDSGGKPVNRHSYLEHKWTFNVSGGNAVTFYIEAYHTPNSEGDDFVFAYSTDDSTYVDMLTVTETSDDNTYQTYALPTTLAGTVYIRVMDTDQTQGNRTPDTIHIDHMYIRSEISNDPPGQASAPSPADGAIDVSTTADLSWTTGSGATSHAVYFGTTPPGDFQGNQSETTFDPGTLAANTTYYWRVDEVNANGTTTGAVWSFTTGASCAPSTMHVNSIIVGAINMGPGTKAGRAEVTVLDNCGNPVSGADVAGTFTGDVSETVTATTDSNGVAVLETSGTNKGHCNVTFCVDNVAHATMTYDPNANVETCDSN